MDFTIIYWACKCAGFCLETAQTECGRNDTPISLALQYNSLDALAELPECRFPVRSSILRIFWHLPVINPRVCDENLCNYTEGHL